VNEYAERDVLAKASLALDGGIFYIIYAGRGDITKPEEKLTGAPYDARTAAMVEGGHIWYASTLKELAEATQTAAAGCTPAFTEEKLRETIEKYNAYVAAQKDDDFGKEVLAGAIDIEAIDANPEVGYCISPARLPCTTPWAVSALTPKPVCFVRTARPLKACGRPAK